MTSNALSRFMQEHSTPSICDKWRRQSGSPICSVGCCRTSEKRGRNPAGYQSNRCLPSASRPVTVVQSSSILAGAARADPGDVLWKRTAAEKTFGAEPAGAGTAQPSGIFWKRSITKAALRAVLARTRTAQPGDLPRKRPAARAALRLQRRGVLVAVLVTATTKSTVACCLSGCRSFRRGIRHAADRGRWDGNGDCKGGEGRQPDGEGVANAHGFLLRVIKNGCG